MSDTNGVIRIGTIGSELTALNGTRITTGTVAEARIDAALARLAGPTLTSDPKAPTATVGDNDTSISTTAFVTAAIEALKALQLWQDTNAVLTALASMNGGSLTNLNASSLASGTVSTGRLSGLLSGLSVGNGQGLLTNTAFPQTYVFTNAGTTNWTIPSGGRRLDMLVIGRGGAGGSGARTPAGTVASGGGGGSGGGIAILSRRVDTLWTNILSIVIPAIAIGGGAVTVDNTFGTNGEAASTTIVYVGAASQSNIVTQASGGSPGVGGDSDGSSGGSSSATISMFAAGSGSASSVSGGVGVAGTTLAIGLSSPGAGSGGGITTGNVQSAGGSGAIGPRVVFSGNASSGGTADGGIGGSYNATWPNDIVRHIVPWPSAGGGGSGDNEAGGAGGNGYGWGSAGGGGGGSRDGFASGAGGNSGPSCVVIVVN